MTLSQSLPNLVSRAMYPTAYRILLLRYPAEPSHSCPPQKTLPSPLSSFFLPVFSVPVNEGIPFLPNHTNKDYGSHFWLFFPPHYFQSTFTPCQFYVLSISRTPSVLVQVIIHFCLEPSFSILAFLFGPRLAPLPAVLDVPARAVFLKHRAVPIGQSRSLQETMHTLPVATQPILRSFSHWA